MTTESNLKLNHIYEGDCLETLRQLPDGCVEMCVTSPPYYALRDYGTGKWIGGDPNCPHYRTSKVTGTSGVSTGHKHMDDVLQPIGDAIYKTVCPLCGAVREDKQIGLEETPEAYINRLADVFDEVKRVLKDDGTLWVNIGDSYATKPKSNYDGKGQGLQDKSYGTGDTTLGYKQQSDRYKLLLHDYKNKDLIGIPWMLAFELRKRGWYLRQDIIWSKPNPMPESVKDRCTKAHEYIFLLSKSPKYFFDYEAIQEPCADPDRTNYQCGSRSNGVNNDRNDNDFGERSKNFSFTNRNKRSVWHVATKPFKEAHFAVFPEQLIAPCINAGSKEGGVVLDPFMGSGTTAVVAKKLSRKFIGCELNLEYIKIAEKRLFNLGESIFDLD